MVAGCPNVDWSTLLWQGLRGQFNKPKFSDLTINVQGESVHVHRVILITQSEALCQLVPDRVTENAAVMNWSAHCNDISDARDFLRSLYFGFGHIHQDNVLGILKLAKIYNVKWLSDEAEKFASSHINHSNVLEFLDFSIFYKCENLKEVCSTKLFKFNKKYSLTKIAQPLVKVWLHVTSKTLHYLISSDRLCVEDEVEVFQYVMCWIEAGQREITSPLSLIRYGFLPSNFYALFALPYVMKVDPPLGTHLSDIQLSCPVFTADNLRKPSPGAMARFRTPRTYRYYRNDPTLYKEAVIQISDDFLSKDKFKKSFPMSEFTLNIEVDERVTISVDVNRSVSSQSIKSKKKNPSTILSNLDEESLISEVKTNQNLDILPSANQHKDRSYHDTMKKSHNLKEGELSLNIDDDASKYSDKSLTSLRAQKSTISHPKQDDLGQWLKKTANTSHKSRFSTRRTKGPLRFEVVDIGDEPEPEPPRVTVDSFTDVEATKSTEDDDDKCGDSIVEITLSDTFSSDPAPDDQEEDREKSKFFDPVYRTHRLFPLENSSITGKIDSLFSAVFSKEWTDKAGENGTPSSGTGRDITSSTGEKPSSSKHSSNSDMVSSEVSSPGPPQSPTPAEPPLRSVLRQKKPPDLPATKHKEKPDSNGTSNPGTSKDTLFYCYCLSPSTRQPLALFRWWNTGGWHRTNFDMLIRQANGTLALGVIVVR